jgi:hypothetical protein
MDWWPGGKKPNLGCLPDMSFRRAVIPGLENAEDFPRTKGTEDFPRTKGTEDFPRTKGAEDFPRTKDAEDFPRTKDAEDFPRTGKRRGHYSEKIVFGISPNGVPRLIW